MSQTSAFESGALKFNDNMPFLLPDGNYVLKSAQIWLGVQF